LYSDSPREGAILSFGAGPMTSQRYDATGNTVGSETRVSTTTADHQFYPSVAALSDGGYVVTWGSLSQDGLGYDVYSRVFAGTTV
jgi:hypothetical protein